MLVYNSFKIGYGIVIQNIVQRYYILNIQKLGNVIFVCDCVIDNSPEY